MSILITIGAMILLLGPLIAIHEYGHYAVARLFKIKVLTYSIGFGPVLFKRVGKNGTTYQVAAIPFGGYVKMADEREGEVPVEDIPHAFNRQPALVKIAVVAAGPLINLVLALVLMWGLLLPAQTVSNTRIGSVMPQSAAAVAGLKDGALITAVDNVPTKTLEQLHLALLNRMGDSGVIKLTAQNAVGQPVQYALPIKDYMKHAGDEPLSALGVLPWMPHLEPVIGSLTKQGPAATQGLQLGDKITAIDGIAIKNWQDISGAIQNKPNAFVMVSYERAGKAYTRKIMLGAMQNANKKLVGQLGVGVEPPKNIVRPDHFSTEVKLSPLEAIPVAWNKTVDLSHMTLSAIGKLVTGHISLDNLSGPISIAQVAGSSAMIGLTAFLQTMAFLSVSLGIMNLLPIPVLDGGHIVYYAIEGITRRPIPLRVQEWGLKLGMALLLIVMVMAISNDLFRVFGT